MAVTDYHRAIFDFLENYRKEHPEAELTYLLRQKNKADRLRNLYLFTGDERYISIGLYLPISHNNKTRSIWFYMGYDPATDTINGCSLTVVFNDPHLLAQQAVYEQIVQQIGTDQFKKVRENRYELYYTNEDWEENLLTYLGKHKPIIDKVLREAGLYEKFHVPISVLEQDILIANQPETDSSSTTVKYTWVPFYLEMCSKLLQYSSAELIEFIKQVLKIQDLVGLKDQLTKGEVSELADVDPYTFLSYINKLSDTKRLAVLALLKNLMGLSTPAPTDIYGLPNTNPQSVWMFAYGYIRKPDDIDQLRALFKQVENNAVTPEQFNRVKLINQVGSTKLTEALFCQKPTYYMPINSQTKPWLKRRGLPFQYADFNGYRNIMKAVRKYDPRPFYEISWEAYLENNPTQLSAIKYYCVGVTFGDQGNQLDQFIREGIWKNGYQEEKEKYVEIIKNIPVGSKLAAKSSFTQGPRGESESVLQIKAIGEVVANEGDGYNLGVAWDEDIKPFSILGKGSYRKTVQAVTRPEDIQLIFFHQPDPLPELMPFPPSIHPKNIILYGPPGTGKTYGTIDLAVEIVDGQKNNYHPVNKIRFDQLRKEGQIEFVTFHQNYTYEDFVMGLKPDVTAGELKFEQREGIFYKIAERARENFEASICRRSKVSLLSFNKAFDKFIKAVREGDDIKLETTSGNDFFITDYHERYGALWIKTPDNRKRQYISDITLSELYRGFKAIEEEGPYCEAIVRAIQEYGVYESNLEPVGLKSYVLVIDEINRANMSRVFGELITLLEDDKRLGGDNELTVTLPSGEPFSVPPNLYLIGTMNTADKSLALLDIALRRRFEFIYKKPEASLLGQPSETILNDLNRAIRDQHKSADFLIGHAYFIGKQKDQLPDVFNNRVIPLLMEYFNGNAKTVIGILAKAGVVVVQDDITDQLTVSYVG